jgi:hypothetical protein
VSNPAYDSAGYWLTVHTLSDVVPRRNHALPNVLVRLSRKTFESAESAGRAISSKRWPLTNDGSRLDLPHPEVFSDRSDGVPRANQLKLDLSAAGYTVNPDPSSQYFLYVVNLLPLSTDPEGTQSVYVGQSAHHRASVTDNTFEDTRQASTELDSGRSTRN